MSELNEQQLAVLNQNYPVTEDSGKLSLPRFGMLSKDIVEESGKGKEKTMKVVQAAGTFYTERDMGEVNEDGKKVWTKSFIEGETIEVIIAYHRKQLRMYDASLEKFYSTPIYDTSEQVLPLFLDKQIVKTGTAAQLQAMWPALTAKGKPSSKLKEETILYVIYQNEMYQLNLSQSSKWSFQDYKKALNPSTVVTTLGSTEETFGTNTYRKMSFNKARMINADEFEVVNEGQTLLKETVEADSQMLLGTSDSSAAAEELKNY